MGDNYGRDVDRDRKWIESIGRNFHNLQERVKDGQIQWMPQRLTDSLVKTIIDRNYLTERETLAARGAVRLVLVDDIMAKQFVRAIETSEKWLDGFRFAFDSSCAEAEAPAGHSSRLLGILRVRDPGNPSIIETHRRIPVMASIGELETGTLACLYVSCKHESRDKDTTFVNAALSSRLIVQ